jgi:para-aminobenzoate synthetase
MSERHTGWSLRSRQIGRAVDPESAFTDIFAEHEHCFWLDSSLVERDRSRFSFFGDCSGPDGEVLRYRVGASAVEVLRASQPVKLAAGSIFEVLEQRLAERAIEHPPELPFDFDCGYAGYFGYEIKADCGSSNKYRSPTPDALWIAATRLIAVDHLEDETWLLALCGPSAESERAADEWLDEAQAQANRLGAPARSQAHDPSGAQELDLEAWLVRSRAQYLADIATCQELLRAGESYEICLTNTFELPYDGDPFELYRRQRRANPAPYAAYLKLPDHSVLCSSPERFLKIDRDGLAESKPIKGTASRQADPQADALAREQLASDPKSQAENLMIVDLLRNDLGRVSEIGSVSVPSLMAVESYKTVHQLVSTVRGQLRKDVGVVGAVRACLPGGSMTGAPKVRTMEIIDSLETRARGVYSGTIGFFGLGGAADLNIVIRTIVIQGGRLTVGAGGAIVLDSDAEEEFEEILLKARAPLRALQAAPIDVAE